MSDNSILGSCHCGSVKYQVSGQVDAFFCHCKSCRLNTGAPYAAWGRVYGNSFELLQGTLNEFNSSSGVSWFFCGNCGTGIKYQNTESTPDVDFLLATLEAPDLISPKYHIQLKEKLPWIEIGDELPKFDRWRNDEV